ncbi:hypothetical protein D0X99_03245 [Algoriphagus lacus]|uniref:Uncharacterized protein n=1 Tax=Algoriphagus lacus TaxID=2056311 RepID=A0A418PX39_9BACT|nr:hypothetical protein D0X99_03245 [Algoriphagus lacus]
MKRNENPTFLEDSSGNFLDGLIKGENSKPKSGTSFQVINLDLPLNRCSVCINAKKKRYLVKLYLKKSEVKNNRILQLRKEKLEKYRINYMPLCSDEDWEMMAAFYAKKSE